jgi:hypothetical protein
MKIYTISYNPYSEKYCVSDGKVPGVRSVIIEQNGIVGLEKYLLSNLSRNRDFQLQFEDIIPEGNRDNLTEILSRSFPLFKGSIILPKTFPKNKR